MGKKLVRTPRAWRWALGRRAKPLLGTHTSDAEEPAAVAVVMPVGDHERDFVDEALESLEGQRHRQLDVLVVPHGEAERVRTQVEDRWAREPRVRVLSTGARSREAALNAGVDAAEAPYVAFVRATDVLPPGALRHLVRSLEDTGSDFVMGRVNPKEKDPGAADLTLWRELPSVQRTSLADLPEAIRDTHQGNRLFSTKFWRSSGLSFPQSDSPHRSDPVIEAFVRAGSFDVIREVTYRDLERDEGLAIGHRGDPLAELPRWLSSQRLARSVLEGTSQAVRAAWVTGLLERDIARFCEDVERAGEEIWDGLGDWVRESLEFAGPDAAQGLSAEAAVRTWLLAHDRRAELEQFTRARRHEKGHRRTEVRDGRVFAMLPFYGEDESMVPLECFEMKLRETPLRAELWGSRWIANDRLELTLFCYVAFVGYEGARPEVAVHLVDRHDRRIELPVEPFNDVYANATAAHRFQDYTPGGCRVVVDAADLVRRTDAEGAGSSWTLEVRLSTRGLTRTGGITSVDQRGTAGGLGTGWIPPHVIKGSRVVVAADAANGVVLSVTDPRLVRLSSAKVAERRVTGTLQAELPVVEVVARRADGLVARAEVSGEAFSLELPDPGYAAGRTHMRHWQLRAVTGTGEESIGWPDGLMSRWLGSSTAGELALGKSRFGNCELIETARTLELDDVRLSDDRLTLRGHWLGREPKNWRVEVRGPGVTVEAARPTVAPDGSVTAEVPAVWDRWGLGPVPLPTGVYRAYVVVDEPGHAESNVLVSAPLWDRLMEEQTSRHHRLRLVKPGRRLRLVLEAPLPDEQRGAFAQRCLRDRYGPAAELNVDPQAVYLQSYNGASATDSQLPIARHLLAERPDLRLYWGVADHSSWVPDGVTPLLMRSEEWFRVRATARYLVSNVDFERQFSKRPGQRFLQTFHGYPSKSMGISLWAGKGFTASMINAEIERTSRDWDLILTPAPEMDEHYRREYRYQGPIHSHGYPRDDVLVSSEAERIRAEARQRLRIHPDQTVVLFAPTWRDHLASTYGRAAEGRHLDIDAASEALGDDYVFLMRGHRYQTRSAAKRRSRSARLLDVTSYPEINHLILAADVAVLDYSSLRFDFALTGRPMLFLVPDLEHYTSGSRGFLYDYRDTAPGPLLDTAEEVIERLRDVDGIRAEHGAAYERFNRSYNYLQDGRSTDTVVDAFFRD